MFERFCHKSRRLLHYAQELAHSQNLTQVDVQHIAYSMFATDFAQLSAALAAFQFSSGQFLSFLTTRYSFDLEELIVLDQTFQVATALQADVQLRLNDDVNNILDAAIQTAFGLRHTQIQPIHIFLGLLKRERCEIAQELRKSGVNFEELRAVCKSSKGTNQQFENVARADQTNMNSSLAYCAELQDLLRRAQRYAEFDGASEVSLDHFLEAIADFQAKVTPEVQPHKTDKLQELEFQNSFLNAFQTDDSLDLSKLFSMARQRSAEFLDWAKLNVWTEAPSHGYPSHDFGPYQSENFTETLNSLIQRAREISENVRDFQIQEDDPCFNSERINYEVKPLALFAAMREFPEATASQVLASITNNPELVFEGATAQLLKRGGRDIEHANYKTNIVLDSAGRHAQSHNAERVDSYHLLLALCEDPNSEAARHLAGFSLTFADLLSEVATPKRHEA